MKKYKFTDPIIHAKHLLSFAILFLCTFLFFNKKANAKKAMPPTGFEVELKATTASGKYAHKATTALTIYNANFKTTGTTPEAKARMYLAKNLKKLSLQDPSLSDLKLYFTRTSDIGTVVRFRQMAGDWEVANTDVVVHIDKNDVVRFVNSTYHKELKMDFAKKSAPSISTTQARLAAFNHLKRTEGSVSFEQINQKVYHHKEKSRLAYEIITIGSNPIGEWHVWVDAHTGKIFKAEDKAVYYGHAGHTHEHESVSAWHPPLAPPMMATGMGNVFDPDPLQSAGVTYGTGGYTDGGDANTTDLNSQLFNETLLDIMLAGGVHTLDGLWTREVDWDAPNDGTQSQVSNMFNFNRSDPGFEAVNIYYHIDASMRYINNTLNCPVAPQQNGGVVEYDPHGANGADNSFYTGATQQLSFGEGCVDDGEDSDVIHHELFHGVHDWVTGGNLSNNEGLSEGSADYWAVSYNRTSPRNQFTAADPQWNWVFNWDGHNACWAGRITDYTAAYPGGLVGQIHTDGQIWSTCMMGIWDQLGAATTDKLMIEGLSMTGATADQDDAANAVFAAAMAMGITGTDLQTIHAQLTSCGYSLPPLPGPPIANFEASSTTVCLDTGGSVDFTDLSTGDPAIVSWSWTFTGATPSSSTVQNPTGITYSAVGMYDVELTVCNNVPECDTQTLTNYINVVSGANCPNDCNATFVDSGGTTGQYGNGENMTWTFCPLDPTTTVIEVTFTLFDLEASGTCAFDDLEVFDGPTNGAPSLGTFCGTNAPGSGTIAATSNNASGCLTFVFTSDGSVTADGWEATMACVPIPSCTDGIQNQDETGVDCGGASCPTCCGNGVQDADEAGIDCGGSDPNCPPCPACNSTFWDSGGASGDYSSNENMTYTFCPDDPTCEIIELTFTSFNTENNGTGCYDGLTIHDGNSTAATTIDPPTGGTIWCWDTNDTPAVGSGDLVANGTITSTDASGCLTVVFTSDGSVTRDGWEANVTCLNNCSCTSDADCDDGDACNGMETCDAVAGCQAGTPLNCDDGNPCNGVETCDAVAGCQAGTPLNCDDGNPCNGVETCDAIAGCQAGTPLNCDDGNPCNGVETCDSAIGCITNPPTTCGNGICDCGETNATCPADCSTTGCTSNADCDDNDPCTTDACDGAGNCVYTAVLDCNCTSTVVACDDNNPCTTGETETVADNGDICVPCGGGTPVNSCGNGICDCGETNATCPADCSTGGCSLTATITEVNGVGGPFITYYDINTIEVTNGTPPYDYNWNTIGFVRHGVVGLGLLRVLFADNATWALTITDANGCQVILSNDLFGSSMLEIKNYTIGSNTNCFNNNPDNGSIDITMEGGTPPYVYNWSGPSGFAATTEDVSGLIAGWYTVMVTDSAGDVTTGWYWVTCGVPGRGKITNELENISLRNYPNPFSEETTIEFAVTETSQTTVSIYSVDGQRLIDVYNDVAESGYNHQLNFHAGPLPAGIYIIQLVTESGEVTHQKLFITK